MKWQSKNKLNLKKIKHGTMKIQLFSYFLKYKSHTLVVVSIDASWEIHIAYFPISFLGEIVKEAIHRINSRFPVKSATLI